MLAGALGQKTETYTSYCDWETLKINSIKNNNFLKCRLCNRVCGIPTKDKTRDFKTSKHAGKLRNDKKVFLIGLAHIWEHLFMSF